MVATDLVARKAFDAATTEQANNAVKAFRRLQPTLTSYARALSGRPSVRVDMAASDNGSTDGTRIYYRPPLALGDATPHERRLCDKRDADTGLPACHACAVREDVLVTIYHEIAHICFDSFAQPTEEDRTRAIAWAVKETGGAWAEKIAARIENAPKYATKSFIGLCSMINEYLPFLLNCLEDARVNNEMFQARTGMRRMFEADTMKVFREGYEARKDDGTFTTVHWSEAPLNSQVMIGVFVMASGYNYKGLFHADVEAALDDEELSRLVGTITTTRTAGAVYNLSFKVLARLRDLGFCGTPRDPDPEPEPEPEEENTPEEEGSNDDESADEEQHGESDPSEEGTPDSDSVSGGDGSADEAGSDADGAGEASSSDEEGSGPDGDADVAPDEPDAEEGEPSDAGDRDNGRDEDDSSDDDSDSGVSRGSDEDGSGGDSTDSDSDDGEAQSTSDDEEEVRGERDAAESGEGGYAGSLSPDGEPDAAPSDEATESVDSPDDGDDEVIDSGADDGYGGTSVDGDDQEVDKRPEMGTPEEANVALLKWNDHAEKPKTAKEQTGEDAVDKAIIQGIYFTRPSVTIYGVRVHKYGVPVIDGTFNYSTAWSPERLERTRKKLGRDADLDIPETILQPVLAKMRRAFTDNRRGGSEINLRSGKVNARSLGKRAAIGDPRLFYKKSRPAAKDYFVAIGMDVSGSTIGRNLALEKRAIMAQAELLNRVGVAFSIHAHTGFYHSIHDTEMGLDLEIYPIKEADEKWDDKTRRRLEEIGPASANLDGHAMEYLRKLLDERSETDKVLLYYSDGKMPAENHDEELDILTSEIRLCRAKGYTLLGVGIRTDSPSRHGLDTVEVHEDDDLVKVINQLGKRLAGAGR